MLRFGDIAFDPAARLLTRAGAPIHLAPKAMDLLALLVERRPTALSKTDIHQRLWPGVFVSDATLSTLVFELRTALGEHARTPKYIRTVHGFGYAFAAEVMAEAPPVCRLVVGGRAVPLGDGEHVIGRSVECAVRLDATEVSRRHARITVRGAQVTLEDCGSTNGTYVDGARITAPLTLVNGMELCFGSVDAVFRAAVEEPRTDLLPARRSSTLERRVRAEVYRHFAETGAAPRLAHLAETLGIGGPDAQAALRALAGAHVLVLDDGGDVEMAPPFSNVPTPYRVTSPHQAWWANCGWDAVGIAPLVGVSTVLAASCPDCGALIDIEVTPDALTADAGLVVHFGVPAARWWDDIRFT